MDEFTQVISAMRKNDLEIASEILLGSTNENIYWLHLFRKAVFTKLDEPHHVARATKNLERLFSGGQERLTPTVAGMFPDDGIREMLIE